VFGRCGFKTLGLQPIVTHLEIVVRFKSSGAISLSNQYETLCAESTIIFVYSTLVKKYGLIPGSRARTRYRIRISYGT